MKLFIRALILIFFVCNASLYAQVYYPVVARVSQTAPYSAYLTDYSNPTQTNLSIQIQQNDRDIASRAIRLRLFVEGQGLLIESTDLVQGETQLVLNYGQVYNLSTAEVANYFKQYNLKINPTQYSRPFAEGAVRFGVQVMDVQTGRALSGVQWSNPVWIALNEPPVWIMPQNETLINVSPIQNVVFQWVPRHTNVNDVEYEFTLKELVYNAYAVGNVQNVFLSQPTFYTTRTTSTTLVYNSLMPPMVKGRVYAYRVRAIAKRGLEEIGVFKNFGYSEVHALFYGEPMLAMKAPAITGLNRDELTNITLLDWKAEANHSDFTVLYREKDKNQSWAGIKIAGILNSTLYKHNFTNLDPSKSYEIRVKAEDRYKQSGYSESVFLDSIKVQQGNEVKLSGRVLWAYSEDQENVNDKSGLISNLTQPQRLLNALPFNVKSGKKRHPLANASIAIVSSDVNNLDSDSGETEFKILKVIKANENGDFSYLTDNLKLNKDLKHIYLIINAAQIGFTKIVKKIGTFGSLNAEINLGELVLTSSSLRYSPKIIGSRVFDLEEMSLYRLNTVVGQNSLLPFEANTGFKDIIAQYNGQTFTKVADFKDNSSIGGLFGNAKFNDYYVLRIKEKNRKEVLIPLASMPDADIKNTLHITDYINYEPLPYKIEGVVSKGGAALAWSTVQVFGKSALTDQQGFYSVHIPETLLTGSSFNIKAVDPLSTGNFKKVSTTFNGTDLKVDFDLESKAFYVEGQIMDEKKLPVNDVIVLVDNTILKTDKNGWFNFHGELSKLPASVKVRRDGYSDLDVPLSQFLKTSLPEGQEPSRFTNLIKSTSVVEKSGFYEESFTDLGLTCSEIHTIAPIELKRRYHYRVITFKEKTSGFLNIVSMTDSADYISANLQVNDSLVSVSKGKAFLSGSKLKGTGGYLGVVTNPQLKITIVNTTGSPQYVDETLILDFPETTEANDTTTFLVQLKEGVQFKGVVKDSTIYIAGLHLPGTVKKAGEKLNPIANVSVEVSGGIKTTTDEQGRFTIMVPVRRDLTLSFNKEGYLKTTTFLEENLSNNYKTNPKDFYMLQLDKNTVPVIKTLMGFDVQIDKLLVYTSDLTNDNVREDILSKGNRTYQISGVININPEGENNFKVDKTLGLKFQNLIVRMEGADSDNAILVYKDANLTETSIKAKLFGYAPVTFSAGGEHPYLRLVPMRGSDEIGQGLIVGTSMKFTQRKMAGLEFGEMKLENTDEEAKATAEKDGMRIVFASLPLQPLSDGMEYKILFPSKVSEAILKKEGIDHTLGSYYKAEFSATNISGAYSGFNLFVNHESATLNNEGVNLDGHFSFPKIWKFKSEGALEISSLEINDKFELSTIQFSKNANSKKGEITKFSIASRWILYVNSLTVGGNFREFGFGGEIVTDKENKLIINSMSFLESGGEYYPSLSISTSEKGLTFKSIKFTTLPGKVISFKRDSENGEYEVSAAFKMEYSGSSSGALAKMLKKIFPLSLQIFEWSTGGKFAVGVAATTKIEVGPIGVSIRRLLYTKGGAISKGDITDFLLKTDAEAEALRNSGRFDQSRKVPLSKAEQEARDAIAIDALYVKKLADEVAEEDPAARWAFAFAGGISANSSSVKGMTFKSDFSFLVGDFGNGTEFILNDIEMNLNSTGFKAYGKVKIVNDTNKEGFEGAVEIETVKIKFAASFKFYQLYNTSGGKTGIELGASIVAKSSLVMGSITWTTIGGGFDLNTAQGKYKFFFKGSAINTGTSKELVEYKDINVSVAFDTQKCSALPVIKGSMSLFINNASFCKGEIELDLCQLRVLGKIDCERELVSGVKAKLNAVITASKDGFLGGCTVYTNFLGTTRNASFALGVEFNTVSSSAKEVSSYVKTLPDYLKHSDNKTFSGIYFNFYEGSSFKTSGRVSIEVFDLVSYSMEISRSFDAHMGLNFSNGSFELRSHVLKWLIEDAVIKKGKVIVPAKYFTYPSVFIAARAEVLGFGLGGSLWAAFEFVGGRDLNGWWYINASAHAELQIYNTTAQDFKCNRVNIKFSKHKVMTYPCGIKCSARWDFWNSCKVKWCDVDMNLPNFKDGIGVKVCISGGFRMSYHQNRGWGFFLN